MKTPGRTDDSNRRSRRRFTKEVAAAMAAAPLVSLMAKAQTPPGAKTKEAAAPPNPQPSPTPQQQQQKPSPVAEAYAAVARARFEEHVTPEQFELIKRDLEGNVRTAERLRSVKLKNADEPDFTFIA
ncbi:MAG TPA: hypothetical protein VM911_09990 [Pyrinomonadaceae bacterium]|nr:hypothetical protein [Pyrinomonadaceae bacterium]